MSSSSRPLGMNAKPSSGYNQHSNRNSPQYVTWKGSGVNQFPVASAPGNIRPLTNNDPGNVFQTGFGLPRPIKHFRRGRAMVAFHEEVDPSANPLVGYNLNRYVKSGTLHDVLDRPGAFAVQQNHPESAQSGMSACVEGCQSIGLVANCQPNVNNWSENPNADTTNPVWCCNQERKARRRSMYATTNLSKNYYTSSTQYLKNRCQTYDQKAFNFVSPVGTGVDHTYVANCRPNAQLNDATTLVFVQQVLAALMVKGIVSPAQVASAKVATVQGLFEWIQSLPEPSMEEASVVFVEFINNPHWGMPALNLNGCTLTVYKPNNPQFAQQGAVSSSTRLLKLNVNTISTNAASLQNYNNTGQFLVNANELYAGEDNSKNFWKQKVPSCNATPPLNMRQTRPHVNNKRYCKIDGGDNY